MKAPVLWMLLVLPAAAQGTLFDRLAQHHGKSYSGTMTFPLQPDHEMNKPMKITVQVVSADQIRVPFQVGEDRSRTWVLSRTPQGIQLKHDHRHADGTPDRLTDYGGTDAGTRLGIQLIFPADAQTTALLPEAVSNVWSLRLSADQKRLFYYLERHAQPRFEAAFELSP